MKNKPHFSKQSKLLLKDCNSVKASNETTLAKMVYNWIVSILEILVLLATLIEAVAFDNEHVKSWLWGPRLISPTCNFCRNMQKSEVQDGLSYKQRKTKYELYPLALHKML